MRAMLVAGLITSALTFGIGSLAGMDLHDRPELVSDELIMEDDPRWNCETMGNRICGS